MIDLEESMISQLRNCGGCAYITLVLVNSELLVNSGLYEFWQINEVLD